ncbi:DNA replication initiation control protein YabA [Streptococcus halichoeri]|uniref:DNA replication initiation control protein YabA n=1 Tax=Streptococcus halichoeri TaxID=254785 RepID=UPI000DB5937A|nr:DNA replication initiation control protein YabA [Streptococcus halichoeri]PZO96086.1 MAG: DNA replication initiation control protein YabA [Streptococcus pyogenes]
MDKRELFDAFDDFSQNLMVTLADIEAMKKQVQGLVEENTVLRLENTKLRERLSQLEHEHENSVKTSPSQGKEHLETIYEEGFHICNFFYGQRRENDEECMFCRELLDRK